MAVVAFRLLRSGGHPAELALGVRKSADAPKAVDAHAWVLSGAIVVAGDTPGLDGYSVLTRIGNAG